MSLKKLDQLRDEYTPAPEIPPKLPLQLDQAAARRLLRETFAGAPDLASAARRGGAAITIVAPDASWVRVMEMVAKEELQAFAMSRGPAISLLSPAMEPADTAVPDDDDDFPPGSTADSVEDPRFPDLDGPPVDRPASDWYIAGRDGTASSPTIDSLEEAAASRIARGVGVIIIGADAADLPPLFTSAADFHLTVPPLTGSMLDQAIATVAQQRPTRTLPDALTAVLTAAHLKMAPRVETHPDDWTARLKRMAEPRVRRPAPGPRLADLRGMDEAVEWGQALCHDLGAFRAGELTLNDLPKGVVVAGPPGVGKTQFIRAVAATCDLPLIVGSYAQWQSAGHQGDCLRAMGGTFAEAKREAKRAGGALLAIDELDSFSSRDLEEPGRNRSYHHQVMNALLEQLDGVHARPGVIVIGTCNHPSLLDPALVRPGRLDRVVHISLPDQAALAAILRYHLGPDHLPGVDLARFVARMEGASGADCEFLARNAKRRARVAGRPMIAADLEAELCPADPRTPALRQLCAVHEAGHAVAAAVLRPSMLVSASIRISAGGLGGVNYRMDGEVLRRNDLLDLIQIHLAGRAAEELLLGAPSTGAGGDGDSDLALATLLATQMLMSHGLGDHLIWSGPVTVHTVPRLLSSNPQIAAQVTAILDTHYAKVRVLLYAWHGAVDHVASLLLARETASATEIIAITNATLHEAQTRTLQ